MTENITTPEGREALATEFRERFDAAGRDGRGLTEHDLADVALAWFAARQPAPVDAETLRRAMFDVIDRQPHGLGLTYDETVALADRLAARATEEMGVRRG